MKTGTNKLSRALAACPAIIVLAVALAGCGRSPLPPASTVATEQPAPPDPLAMLLTPHLGDGRVDAEIRQRQEQFRAGRQPDIALERLGWLFVAKARESFDNGYYKLAEQCALCLGQRNSQSHEAMLLRGHVLHSLHRFKEAEALARRLIEERGLGFDFGLLGDVLMEQGKLRDAVGAYQQMMDLKPDLFAYARAAHIRWLKGDLDGAIEAMRLAVSAACPQDAESAAWVNTRLANYEFQAGRFEEAERRCAFALALQTNYAPVLLLRGKMLLAQNKSPQAVDVLQLAAKLNPLPEYQWTLAEALRAAGREDEALAVEGFLGKRGAAADPRTLSLYLATRRQAGEMAVRLAERELHDRDDVFSHDALAWALTWARRIEEARTHMERALAEGTQDGRLFFHAAVISSQSGNDAESQRWSEKAHGLAHLLLPSERKELQSLARTTNQSAAVVSQAQVEFSARNY